MGELIAWLRKHPNVKVSFCKQMDLQYITMEIDNMYVHDVDYGYSTRRVTSKQIDQYTLIRPDEFVNVLNKMYDHTLQVTYDD